VTLALQVTAVRVTDFAALEIDWRALEATASDLSFFQSWTWIGCRVEERFPDPVLLRAEVEGRLVGLALFNRRRGRLLLGESGDPALDAPFVEHNGPLLGHGYGPEAAAAIIAAAWRVPGTRRLVLSGVPPSIAEMAGGISLRAQERLAPFLDLAKIRASGGNWMRALSSNTRQQLRRSARYYAERGPLLIERASGLTEAKAWFEALMNLHGQRWKARGQPGAFATPYLRRFHHTLIARALARDELDLLRVRAGQDVIGHLYNLRLRGRVFAYQSGFAYADAGPHGRPGLTCHALAIERALAEGEAVYDFLAPADRYKTSLSSGAAPLVWRDAVSSRSLLGIAAWIRRGLWASAAQLRRS
jgi:CelD/BcsL family acetyltransferase involved in cellulose biosynthesis